MGVQHHESGGSLRLAELIDQYGEALEYDFQRYLNLDLRDFITGADNPARAMRLIGFLPEGGAFKAMLRADAQESKKPGRKPEPWEEWYEVSPEVAALHSVYWAVLIAAGVDADKAVHPGAPGQQSRRRGQLLIPDD